MESCTASSFAGTGFVVPAAVVGADGAAAGAVCADATARRSNAKVVAASETRRRNVWGNSGLTVWGYLVTVAERTDRFVRHNWLSTSCAGVAAIFAAIEFDSRLNPIAK